MLKVKKELFQWEKNQYVYVDNTNTEYNISHIQFYNKKSSYGPEIAVEEGRAKIPNYLLKENLPIVALGCIKDSENSENLEVVCRKIFKVLPRPKPEFYIDDDNTFKDVIYDGGVEV